MGSSNTNPDFINLGGQRVENAYKQLKDNADLDSRPGMAEPVMFGPTDPDIRGGLTPALESYTMTYKGAPGGEMIGGLSINTNPYNKPIPGTTGFVNRTSTSAGGNTFFSDCCTPVTKVDRVPAGGYTPGLRVEGKRYYQCYSGTISLGGQPPVPFLVKHILATPEKAAAYPTEHPEVFVNGDGYCILTNVVSPSTVEI